ncbi:MAG TPA: twin-arginine translocase TatA/TatE family subunit [Deltaproteobacteria bacterium]|nr:twin-arginine translocase TatA/TatE family subunit [Deltaproteobacteria bacterium]HIJ36439.1 twin-arginine translocase TatA/TatE family subunit [Deltaproteobacteria bacterium]HIJ39612.1 twin-arginine translocase TatA/TatE family subunit [Deltaproteobacteria bacterium]
MFGLGPTELIIIAVIVILIFGAKRLPDVGKGLGGAIREFRNVKKELSKTSPDTAANEDKPSQAESDTPLLQSKMAEKALEQVPVVKKVMEVKKKADAVKNLLQ